MIGAVDERLGDLEAIDHYDVGQPAAVGRRIVYDVKANWKLIIENFMECYHCATIHPELTEVLPEFADGSPRSTSSATAPSSARTSRASPSTAPKGWTGFPGVGEDQDRRYYAITIRPTVFVNLVPDHVIFHRMFPHGRGPHHRRVRLAVPARASWRAARTSARRWSCSTGSTGRTSTPASGASRRWARGCTRKGGVLVPSEHHIGDFHDWVQEKVGTYPRLAGSWCEPAETQRWLGFSGKPDTSVSYRPV